MIWWCNIAMAGGWKVVDTPHYQVYYPIEAEEFSLHAAAQLEAIRQRVANEVGFEPDFKTQIVVRDPYGVANGLAIPLGRSPRVELWATPPSADSSIGFYDDWAVDLVLHEDVHVVHMLTPPRGVSGQVMYWLFNVAPIQVKAPGWVLEGYATLVEGSLTGAGRPNGDFRATVLRQMAVAGDLPTYAELAGSPRWMGGSVPYLVGSSFLEWLDQRAGPGSLNKLWTRMTARRVRDFEQSFQGVYGDRVEVLYKRYCAELTAAAVGADAPSSSLWMRTQGSIGRLAVSPDGARVAFVQRPVLGDATLVVWKTEVDQKAVKRREELVAKVLLRDPVDAIGVLPKTPPRTREKLWLHKTHIPEAPRWLDDETLVYVATVADAEGRVRRDVYRWRLKGRPHRLTHGADIHEVDVQGGRMVGLSSSWGRTGLVEIDLEGKLTPLIEPSALRVLDQPRLSPDGSSVAYLRNDGKGFRLWIKGVNGEREVPLPSGWQIRQIAWGPDGIVASIGVEGRIDLYRLGEGEPLRLTTVGAAFAPEPVGENVYHLEMHSRGYSIHRIDSDVPGRPVEEGGMGLAGRPEAPEVAALALTPAAPRPMRLGRLEPRVLVSGMVGARASNFEAGLRLGDVVGRNEFTLLGSLGDAGGATGVGGWWTNQTLPLDLTVQAWALRQGRGPDVLLGASGRFLADTGASATVAEAAFGGWVESGRGAGIVQLGAAFIEPKGRWLQGGLDLHGSVGADAGQPSALAELGAQLSLGSTWTLRGEATLGVSTGASFSLGGVRSAARAPMAQWSTLQIGWLAPGTDSGRTHDFVRAEFGAGGMGLRVDRRRLHDASGTRAYSFAGLVMHRDLDEQPLVRLPALAVEMGFGCAFEQDGLVDRACRKIGDYRGWSAITWTP